MQAITSDPVLGTRTRIRSDHIRGGDDPTEACRRRVDETLRVVCLQHGAVTDRHGRIHETADALHGLPCEQLPVSVERQHRPLALAVGATDDVTRGERNARGVRVEAPAILVVANRALELC